MANESLGANSQFQIGGITKLVGSEMQIPRSVEIGKGIKMLKKEDDDQNLLPKGLTPEEEERRRKDGSLTTLEGQEFLQMVKDADIISFPNVAREVLSFAEGLQMGPEDYNLEDKFELSIIKAQFLSVDSSIDRPENPYIKPALKQKTGETVRNLKRLKRRKGQFDDEEQHIVEKMVRMDAHIEARQIADKAFIHRQMTCENPDGAAELMNKGASTPDADVWIGLFQADKEFGEGVDKVLRRIVDAAYTKDGFARRDQENLPGVPQTVYADGFANSKGVADTQVFKRWLEHMLDAADGRMDVVWTAWKLALTWELINDFGKGIAKNKAGNDVYILADPPLGSALFTWVTHLHEKRTIEFGWDINNQDISPVKYISHSGLPLTIDVFDQPLCEGYLKNSTITFMNKEGSATPSRQKSLFEIWYEDGLSFADENFPWVRTEEPNPAVDDPGEMAGGSFGGWFLKRFRANNVRKTINSVAELSGGPDTNIGHHNFFALKTRDWEKMKLIDKSSNVPTAKYPPAMWLAAQIEYHLPSTGVSGMVKKNNDLIGQDWRSVQGKELIEIARSGAQIKGVGHGDVLMSAKNCGFIRPQDVEGICDILGIPKNLL